VRLSRCREGPRLRVFALFINDTRATSHSEASHMFKIKQKMCANVSKGAPNWVMDKEHLTSNNLNAQFTSCRNKFPDKQKFNLLSVNKVFVWHVQNISPPF